MKWIDKIFGHSPTLSQTQIKDLIQKDIEDWSQDEQELVLNNDFNNEAIEGFKSIDSSTYSDFEFAKKRINSKLFTSHNYVIWLSALAFIIMSAIIFKTQFNTENQQMDVAEVYNLPNIEIPLIENVVIDNNLENSSVDIQTEPTKNIVLNNQKENPVTPNQKNEMEKPITLNTKIDTPKFDNKVKPSIPNKKEFMGFEVVDYSRIYEGKMFNIKTYDLTGTPASLQEKYKGYEDSPVLYVSYDVFSELIFAQLQSGHHKKAIVGLDKLLNKFPSDVNAIYYKGYAYLKLNKYEYAKKYFQQAIAHPNALFDQKAKSFLTEMNNK